MTSQKRNGASEGAPNEIPDSKVDSAARNEEQGLRLRVVEAHPKDAGRGIVRIDPADLEKIGASIGDIISIEGERRTVGKAMPAYLPDRGKKLIQVDGITRETWARASTCRSWLSAAKWRMPNRWCSSQWRTHSARGATNRSISAGCWKGGRL